MWGGEEVQIILPGEARAANLGGLSPAWGTLGDDRRR
jgi:hypothetical protein